MPRARRNPPLRVRASRSPCLPAFTIIEVLIVVGVVILLLSILLVAVNKAVEASQSANTKSLLTGIRNGLVQFKEDVGYYPPLLDDDRGLRYPPTPDPVANPNNYAQQIQDFHSRTSIAEYLIGYGNGAADGHGQFADATKPALGIRSPGSDGVWSATVLGDADGTFDSRKPTVDGRVLGPYLELKDDRLLGGIDTSGNLVFPGEDPNFGDYPKVVVDYWGSPIRYYRRLYPSGALRQSFRSTDRNGDNITDRVPTLSDVFVLRPYDSDAGEAATVPDFLRDGSSIQFGGSAGDPTTSTALNAGEFALLSPGPDKAFDETVRYDDQDYDDDGFEFSNQDNIVEIGP